MKTFNDVAAAQFMIHVTVDVCSLSPAVKGCLDELRRIPIRDHTCCGIRRWCFAGEEGQDKRQWPVAIGRLDDLH